MMGMHLTSLIVGILLGYFVVPHLMAFFPGGRR